jgi:glycosyltransferase involved in cell wall biosynthesis
MNKSALDRSSRGHLTVSVVVITYNGARYIGDQVQSIIRQTRAPEEIIISDDASNDDTVERARSALRSWHGQSHVRIARRNVGVSANLQAGLEEATGDVVMLADQDDIWWPQRVERQMAAIENDPSVAAVFCDADLVDAEGHAVGARLWEREGFSVKQRRIWARDPAAVLLGGQVVTGATLALRRELLDVVLPLPTSGWHDSWIALVTVFSGAEMLALPEALLSYRLHDDNAAGVPPPTWRSKLGAALWPGGGDLAQLSEAIERLETAGADSAAGDGTLLIDRLKRARNFYVNRRRLDARFWRRAPRIARWWFKGEYSCCRSGLRSAVADLAVAGLRSRHESGTASQS